MLTIQPTPQCESWRFHPVKMSANGLITETGAWEGAHTVTRRIVFRHCGESGTVKPFLRISFPSIT